MGNRSEMGMMFALNKSLYKLTLSTMNGFCIYDILVTAECSNSWQGGDGEVMLGARDSAGKTEIMGSAQLCNFGCIYQ